jgi:DNA replication regulator DPB11
MGADHKLDLTSDVTHLLVGDANTPKYKYVAREREDVKVLQPEWIEAVRDIWMKDVGIDLSALEAQYKLPTFAGLTICITGFDDLNFRAQLQQKIDEEGGKYTGDLTKHVTHLIAYKAEGKKYQYAMQWGKQIVTLQWLKDSLERGMQLDETKYHPSIAHEDQGKGAWNREAKLVNQLGKRSRPQEPIVEPSRKLRRTASAKFSSQNEAIWADIYRKPGNERQEREPLRPSKSMSSIRTPVEVDGGNVEPGKPLGQEAANNDHENQPTQHRTSELSHGFFDGCYFVLDSFDSRKTEILKGIVLGQGGTLLEAIKDLDDLQHVPAEDCFLIVPHDMGAITATKTAQRRNHCQIVTELWVEICVEKRQRVPPSAYPLGTLLLPLGNLLLPNGRPQKISVNSSGFPGIQRNHVAKAVNAIGATYEEVLKPGASVLICYSASSSIDKMRHAREWKVPVVTPEWLWATLKEGTAASFQDYTIRSNNPAENVEPIKKQVRMQIQDSFVNEDRLVGHGRARFADEVPTQPLPRKAPDEKLAAKQRPGSDFLPSKKATTYDAGDAIEPVERAHVTHARPSNRVNANPDLPLQETSGNSPPKARSLSPKKRRPLFQTLDGASSIPESDQDDLRPKAVLHPGLEAKKHAQDAGLLNGAIQDLLNQTTRTKSLTSSALAAQTNKQPLSRALSNVSNASLGSRARASRAGSVSSVNTDGLGSEIAMEATDPGRTASSSRGRGSFTGRAKARDESQPVQRPSSVELNDPGMFREDLVEEEVAPQLTQLGYEDPEEAIALRAKLAEKRRKKARAGQEEPGPEAVEEKAAPPRRIQDDDAILGAKWGGGRRLRQQKD